MLRFEMQLACISQQKDTLKKAVKEFNELHGIQDRLMKEANEIFDMFKNKVILAQPLPHFKGKPTPQEVRRAMEDIVS